jgi:hypothetical protein
MPRKKNKHKSKIPTVTPRKVDTSSSASSSKEDTESNSFWSLSEDRMVREIEGSELNVKETSIESKPPPMPPERRFSSRFDKDFEDLLRELFRLDPEDANEIFESLEYDGITSWDRFVLSSKEMISDLSKSTGRTRVPIAKYFAHQLKAMHQMTRDKMQEDYDSGYDISTYNADDIRRYTSKYIELKRDETGFVQPTTTKDDVHINKTKPRTEKALDNWERKTHDSSKFLILHKDSGYKLWKEKFVSQIKVKGLYRLVDPSFKTSQLQDQHDRELYEKQNDYFWTVLEHSLRNPLSEDILGDHRGQNDGRAAFLEIDKVLQKGIAQMYNVGNLSDVLEDMHISSFVGTRVEFLVKWFETLRHLQNSAGAGKMSFVLIRTKLMRATNSDTDLNNAFTDLQAETDETVAYMNLKHHMLEKATTYDGRDASARTGTSSTSKIVAQAHMMNIYDDDTINIMINQSRRGNQRRGPNPERRGPNPACKLPDSIYHTMGRDDKIHWREMSDDTKRQIISLPRTDGSNNHNEGTRKAYQHSQDDTWESTQSSDGDLTSEMEQQQSDFNTLRAFNATISEATATLQPLMQSLEIYKNNVGSITPSNISSLSRPTSSNPSDAHQTASNQHSKGLPLKSSLGSGNPSRVMAGMPEKNKKIQQRNISFHGGTYQASQHHLFYTPREEELDRNTDENTQQIVYNVSKRKVNNKQTSSLVDRGANGIVAGDDCTWIGGPSIKRSVHITGMNNHQICDIPVGIVGAYVVSNRGPVICIFHEAAYTGRHQTILSAIQMEHYNIRVDDRSINSGGGQQITTADGFNFPLSISNGLPYLKMRPYTNDEYKKLPHVIMTSDKEWDPRIFDNDVNPNDEAYKIANPENLHLLPTEEYDVKGEFIGANNTNVETTAQQDVEFWLSEAAYLHAESVDRCIHGSQDKHILDHRTDDAYEAYGTDIYARQEPRTHQANKQDYEGMRPYFAWIPSKLIEHTFKNSTQYGYMPASPDGQLFKRWNSPNPAMNVFRLQDDVLTDKVYSNTPAINGGFTEAQIFFGRKCHIIHPEPTSKTKKFLQCLQNFVRTWGAPIRLLADHVSYHASFQVLDYLRILWIQLWFSEAYYQHQNPFERRYQTFKRIVNRTMDRTGTPPEFWYLCMCYVAYVLNRVADPTLNYKQPIHVATGRIGDISAITTYQWMEPVYFKKDNKQFSFPDTGEGFGFFVGIAENVGHEMTYRIWNKETGKIIDRSAIRTAWDEKFPNKRADAYSPFHEIPTSTHSEQAPGIRNPSIRSDNSHLTTDQDYGEKNSGRPPDFIYSERHPDAPVPMITPDHTNYGEETYLRDGESTEDTLPTLPNVTLGEDGTPMVILQDDDGNAKLDAEGNAILIPGMQPEELPGITFKYRQDDGSTLRARVLTPNENNLHSEKGLKTFTDFKIKYDRNQVEDTMAYNDIINHIHRDQLEEDGQVWKFRRILAHRGPLTHRDPDYKRCKYNVSIEWENGEITEESLRWMIQEDPITMAEYARDNNLLELEGWKSLKRIAKREKMLKRLVRQVKLRSFRTAPKYMYGYRVPRNYDEAMEFDLQNGNSNWSEATSLEMTQLHEYDVFIDRGLYTQIGIPSGFKKIRVHLVFAVKHDGRHKARLVADGHLTDVPLNSVYAGVVSIRGLRICIFLAELNGMEAYATDIGNAYLEAVTREKVCIRAGPEFGTLEGHLLIVYKALYGLRSSGKQFGDLLAACLKELGFFASRAEPQIFMRKNDGIYEYIATYVDDLCFVVKDPDALLKQLQSAPYHFKLKGSGPMSFHLGCGFERDKTGILCMNPLKYIEKMAQAYEQLFGVKLGTRAKSPLEEGDHPELDTSEFLDDEDTQKYQSLIGSLQWVITLGRWDVQTAVMTLSSFRAKPRKGHLERAKRVCSYINKFKHFVLRFRVDEPDLSHLDGATKMDWSKDVYEEFDEQIPSDAPMPLGKSVTLIHWFDANLMHDVLSGKAVTGCIHFANKTPIMWYSKKQATTETATYGAEFCAGRTCIEQIVDLRNTLRYLGVPVHNISYVFGDNKSMIDSSTYPYARMHKRHNILSFHYVRSMIARGFIALTHTASQDNLADVVTKHWAYNSVYSLLRPVFHHMGDTSELFIDDESS